MHSSISPTNFDHYTYSRKSHLSVLARYAYELYGREVDFSLCDLKSYQDLLVFGFIKENIPTGSKILEIGGGHSRVLNKLADTYECWNIDKHEGLGNGPKAPQRQYNSRLILDYIGNFTPHLPNEYFDFVFSISVLEHSPPDKNEIYSKILADINRTLAPNAFSLHCLDLVKHPKHIWTNPLLLYLFANLPTINIFIPLDELLTAEDMHVMTQEAYDRNWKSITCKDYMLFGKPFSYNILWRRHNHG